MSEEFRDKFTAQQESIDSLKKDLENQQKEIEELRQTVENLKSKLSQ